ncbi:MAG: ATP-grasp domain-containing protein [bacterium]
MKANYKILICYNEPVEFFNNYIGKEITSPGENNDLSESAFFHNLETIKNLLIQKFESVKTYGINKNIRKAINDIGKLSPDIIFNFVESVEGDSVFESYIAGMFDIFNIHYTGNTALCLGNCLNKIKTKQILLSNDIKTPRYIVGKYPNTVRSNEFKISFPVILKLAGEDASIGISEFSIVDNLRQLNERLVFLYSTYKQDVLIEEYIEGRELNVSILGDEVLPISEIDFTGLPDNLPKIITYEAKWSPDSVYYEYTNPKLADDLKPKLLERIKRTALAAYHAMGCRDYVRVDIRISKRDVPYVIEINPNPDISPDAGFVRAAKNANISYSDMLYKIGMFAIQRKKNDTQIREKRPAAS